ncbi:molybdate ABC transporter substrate-binding protein [Bacillus alveayuensis]|uniref:molybdate ABC transporter substrate-binding protein n=1 Tax=Aeribacillus alveayuensis TaxID=279215 RepID=UPI0009FCEF8F
MKLLKRLFLLLAIIIFSVGCTQNEPDEKVELTVSAAASLQNALLEIKESFEKKHEHIHLSFNFGSSGALERQISQGAPVDIFFSASEDKFDNLVQQGLINQRKNLVGNELVLVVPYESKNKINRFQDLKNDHIQHVAIGIPEVVPAGKYAKESLQNLNIWNDIEQKIIFAKDVRQVLSYVETGNVDAGIVYRTDARISNKVKIVATAEENIHFPIIYPIGIIKNTNHLEEAKLFYQFMQKEDAMQILKKYGFKELNES